MSMRTILSLAASVLLLGSCTARQEGMTPQQAAQHVGETATVCGTIASTNYSFSSSGESTFINLGPSWPKEIFTVVIWGNHLPHFTKPPERWRGRLCVTGYITSYHGKVEIKVTDPSQIHR